MPKFTYTVHWEEGSIEEFERVYGHLVQQQRMAPPSQAAYPPPTSSPAPAQVDEQTQRLLQAIAQLQQSVQSQQASPPATQRNSRTELLLTDSEEYLKRLENMTPTEIDRLYPQDPVRGRHREGQIERWLGQQSGLVMLGIYLVIVLTSAAALLQHPQFRQVVQGMFTKAPAAMESPKKSSSPQPRKASPTPDVIPAPPPP